MARPFDALHGGEGRYPNLDSTPRCERFEGAQAQPHGFGQHGARRTCTLATQPGRNRIDGGTGFGGVELFAWHGSTVNGVPPTAVVGGSLSFNLLRAVRWSEISEV